MSGTNKITSVDHCPHCGAKLSSWDQVLLKVDRVLVCKSCWYRIILPADQHDEDSNNPMKEE